MTRESNNATALDRDSGSLLRFFAIVSLAYVVAIGPAFRILPFPAAGFLYWPLVKLAHIFPAFSHLLAWYMVDIWKYTIPMTI